MKRAPILIAFIAMAFAVKAQDLIVLRNANEIQAKVESVGQNEVVYRKFSNIEGPTYTLAKSEIFFIKYASGEKDTFAEHMTTNQPNLVVRANKKYVEENFSKLKFQGYTYLGADFSGFMGGPSLDFSFGTRTSKYFYLGAGVGWHNLIEDYYFSFAHYTEWLPYLTFTSDLKVYIPTKVKGLYPRLDLSFGGCVDPYDALAGFYMSCGAGVDYRKFSFGIGYQMPVIANVVLPLGYVRLGVRFGK